MNLKRGRGYPGLILDLTGETKIFTPGAQDIIRMNRAIDSLSPKETKAIRMYYGLNVPAKTQADIGHEFGVTTCRGGQILGRALGKLKHSRRRRAFEGCTEKKRAEVLEEDNENLIKEVAKLKEEIRNSIKSLMFILEDFMSEESAFERDLGDYFRKEEDENKKALEELFAEEKASTAPGAFAKSVDEFNMTIRARNCLKNANVKTIGELAQKTELELLKMKNFGRNSLNELREILRGLGLYFGMKVG